MLVEDNEAVRILLSTILKDLRYTVLEACNGEQALEIFNTLGNKIDLVVSDIIMPKMNGMELYRELQKIDITTKVILMSGHSEQAISLKELNKGNVRLLNKPFSVQKFAGTIRSLFDKTGHIGVA